MTKRPARRRGATGASKGGTEVPPAQTDVPPARDRQWFRTRLLAWYRANGRSLPWRETSDPYHILVSEVMLQQTQVDRVLPKYHEWLGKYPTLSALADAPDAEVAETWRPLGYNIRPRRLQWIAREAVASYGGSLPSDEQTLLSFKGLGRYTVGAIRSFAFRERAAILDTNVARVLFRVFIGDGDPKAHATVRRLWRISETLVPRKHVFDFNQALMDFGATLCTARKPQCLLCPLRRGCRSFPWTPDTITKARRREATKDGTTVNGTAPARGTARSTRHKAPGTARGTVHRARGTDK